MKRLFLFFIFSPFLLFADLREDYVELFGENFNVQEIQQCNDILDDWEKNIPEDYGILEGLRATILLSEGKLNESNMKMEKALLIMGESFMSPKTAALIREYFLKAQEFDDDHYVSTSSNSSFYIELCNNKQPRGVKFRYWFGVAQIVAGCITAPFSAGTSIALVTAGTATLGSAVGDSLDNKDRWEEDLNHRQKIAPKDASYVLPTRINLYPEIIRV